MLKFLQADNDTYTTGAAQSICSGASLPSGYRAAASGADCNDADATKWQNLTGYTDADADGYGGASASVCSGASLPAPYVATGGDCYDSNANAKPGQTLYGAVNRGDGSYDYDCSGIVTTYPFAYRTIGSNGSTNSTDPYTLITTCGVNGSTVNVESPVSSSYCGTNTFAGNGCGTWAVCGGNINNCVTNTGAIYYIGNGWTGGGCTSSSCGVGSSCAGGSYIGSFDCLQGGTPDYNVIGYSGASITAMPLPCR